MSYHQAPSSPTYQYDAYSPTSPISINHDHQRHQTHTPKRRRIENGNPDFDPTAQDFIPHNQMFDPFAALSWSPPTELAHRSPPPVPQNTAASPPGWDVEHRWIDASGFGPVDDQTEAHHRLQEAMSHRPSFADYLTHASDPYRGYRRLPDYHSWGMPQMPTHAPPLSSYIGPPRMQHSPPNEPPRLHEYQRHSIPPPHMSLQGLPITPLQRIPVHVHQSQQSQQVPQVQPPQAVPVPPTSIRRKGAITLSLSRANDQSIGDLPEHKRECPACQLEFEPDNYLAVISCCGTAMHATCFSAWVNSQTYSKTKVCMKCRKAIDARRALNNVVPPVTDKSWDEGVDFDAPPHVLGDAKTEIDISGRNDAMYRRIAQMRRDPSSYRRRAPLLNEHDLPTESRPAFQELQREIRKESDELRARYRNARHDWRTAFEAEARAAQGVVEAKDALQAGLGMTQREVEGLSERLQEAKESQVHRYGVYRATAREMDEQDRRHQTRQVTFLEQIVRR